MMLIVNYLVEGGLVKAPSASSSSFSYSANSEVSQTNFVQLSKVLQSDDPFFPSVEMSQKLIYDHLITIRDENISQTFDENLSSPSSFSSPTPTDLGSAKAPGAAKGNKTENKKRRIISVDSRECATQWNDSSTSLRHNSKELPICRHSVAICPIK